MKINNNKLSNFQKGIKIRREILKRLPNNIYRLSKELKKSPATIQHHLNILAKQMKVHFFKKEENGRIQKIYSILELNPKKNTVKLSKELFKIINNKIYGYALSGNTFGICNRLKKEWQDISLWSNSLQFQETGNNIEIKIPEILMNFYKIPFNAINPTYSNKKDCVLLSF
ncbi:MAG: hypothetical protein ACTSO9_18365 [Candidatus Helarchaeota archaeon]